MITTVYLFCRERIDQQMVMCARYIDSFVFAILFACDYYAKGVSIDRAWQDENRKDTYLRCDEFVVMLDFCDREDF